MTEDATRRSRRSRRKGAKGETEVLELIRKHGFEGNREPGSRVDVTVHGADLILEVKRRAKKEDLKLWQARDQARSAAKGKDWAVVARTDRDDWVVLVDADHYFGLLEQVYGLCQDDNG